MEIRKLRNMNRKVITYVSDLIREIKKQPKEIILCESLYKWLIESDWECLLSDDLKQYIKRGGRVIKYKQN